MYILFPSRLLPFCELWAAVDFSECLQLPSILVSYLLWHCLRMWHTVENTINTFMPSTQLCQNPLAIFTMQSGWVLLAAVTDNPQTSVPQHNGSLFLVHVMSVYLVLQLSAKQWLGVLGYFTLCFCHPPHVISKSLGTEGELTKSSSLATTTLYCDGWEECVLR